MKKEPTVIASVEPDDSWWNRKPDGSWCCAVTVGTCALHQLNRKASGQFCCYAGDPCHKHAPGLDVENR